MLLDLGNLYANALNEGREPREVLLRYPLDRVAMVHVAGGIREHGFYFDTHAHAIPPEVVALAGEVIARCGSVPLLIERDANFDVAELARELESLRALRGEPRGARTLVARSLTKYFTPHPRGEPHFFTKPCALVKTSPGASTVIEGRNGAGYDVMRGVVQTDTFHAAPSVFHLWQPGRRIEVRRGEVLAELFPAPRHLLDATFDLQRGGASADVWRRP